MIKSVPPDVLEANVEGLAGRLAMIDPDPLAANKRMVNLDLELRGARTLRRLAAENDTRSHLAPGTQSFRMRAREQGLRAALQQRDRQFFDGRTRVGGSEIRDAKCRLVND